MRSITFQLIFVVCWCGLSLRAEAQSLWTQRDPHQAFLFYDTQARYVGDLITIVINENTDIENSEDRELSKESDTDRSFSFSTMMGGKFGSSSADAESELDQSSRRSFDGSASFRSEQEFSTRVTASVVDVLPNGNLVVAGKRRVFVAGDRRLLSVSGVVRPYDVGPNNTVQSRFLSNLMMTYDAEGQEQRYTRRGWLGRVIDKLWPE